MKSTNSRTAVSSELTDTEDTVSTRLTDLASIHELVSAVSVFRLTTISDCVYTVRPSIGFGVTIPTVYLPGTRNSFSSEISLISGVYSLESPFPVLESSFLSGGVSVILEPCHSDSCCLSCIANTSEPNPGRMPGSTWTLAEATGPSSETETTLSPDSCSLRREPRHPVDVTATIPTPIPRRLNIVFTSPGTRHTSVPASL